MDIQSQIIPTRINSKIPTQKHIITKQLKGKDKERNLKASREKTTHYIQGSFYKIISEFLGQIHAARKALEWYSQIGKRKTVKQE